MISLTLANNMEMFSCTKFYLLLNILKLLIKFNVNNQEASSLFNHLRPTYFTFENIAKVCNDNTKSLKNIFSPIYLFLSYLTADGA